VVKDSPERKEEGRRRKKKEENQDHFERQFLFSDQRSTRNGQKRKEIKK